MRLKTTAVGLTLLITFLVTTLSVQHLQAEPQRPEQRRRINEPVNDRRTVRLPQTTHSRIRQAQDKGRVSGDLPMERVVLTLHSDPAQQTELESFLAEQQDPSSPHFHEWLTPQQFGERFGASAADIDAIVQWLQSHGLRTTGISNGRREIEFSGTARQIEEAFQSEIHNYQFNGEMHVANAKDISIPEALAPVVSGVVSLHDFTPKPKFHRQPIAANFTFGSRHGMVPYDFATIYDVAALWNEGFDGTGQTIAVVGRSNLDPNDVATFRSLNGLPANTPEIIVNGTDPGVVSQDEEGEADLDVQWSGAVARGAKIRFVVSKSTRSTDGSVLSEMYIVNNNVAPVLTTSFGFCEVMSPSTSRFYANLWQQAAAEGISVFVASGDSGAATCDDSSATAAKLGVSVDGEASTPYNVAVGGSQFNENGSDSIYWNATNNNQNRSSAKSYIPEVVWNESGPDGLWSSGGGVSTVHATPSWQTGLGVPTVDPGTTGQHHRYVPDVSLNAAGHDGYIAQQRGSLVIFTGTSASAPAFAGIMAILNQATNQANGNPNPRLYALAAQVPAVFHDVTSGSNAVPCVAGSPNCSGGTIAGYTAGPGYDLVTGWGSVDAYRFVHAWAGTAVPPPPPALTITTSSILTSTAAGTAFTLNLTASGGTPPYQWAVMSGTLPPGLTLDPSGILSGTPTTSGSYSFAISVTDSGGANNSQTFQITITSPVSSGGASSSSATAATYHVFPQFADGRQADGTYYRTTLMISNTSSSDTTCNLQLRGLTVPGFSLSYPVAANAWTIASTTGAQIFQSGYATLQCGAKVEAQLLYSYYSSDDSKLAEATVFSSPASPSVLVVADQREDAQLGLAIANDSDQTVNYTISVGGVTGPGFTLKPRTSLAKFIKELVPGVAANTLGIVRISSSTGSASVVGLRFTGSIFT